MLLMRINHFPWQAWNVPPMAGGSRFGVRETGRTAAEQVHSSVSAASETHFDYFGGSNKTFSFSNASAFHFHIHI